MHGSPDDHDEARPTGILSRVHPWHPRDRKRGRGLPVAGVEV